MAGLKDILIIVPELSLRVLNLICIELTTHRIITITFKKAAKVYVDIIMVLSMDGKIGFSCHILKPQLFNLFRCGIVEDCFNMFGSIHNF